MDLKKIVHNRKRIWQIVLMAAITIWFAAMALSSSDWRTADMSSAGLAPNPKEVKEAVVQVYAARTFNWRGYFAVHTWVAAKEKNAATYKTYQVIGFYLRRNGTAVVIQNDIPDRKWYGAMPEVLQELRGEDAERAIPEIAKAANSYPYSQYYNPWPGPNSNSFVAHIIRHVPELTVELPPNAIGKDWINRGDIFGRSESGTGYQLSLMGLFGITLGKAEGFEINILGLNFGIDILNPALKLPLIGRIGFKDKPYLND